MKNQWIEFLRGIVTVKTTGKGIERFINMLTRDGISIWNVKSHGTQTIIFQMKLEDAKKIRRYAKKTECKISFLHRRGFPFLTLRLLRNSGFLIGAVAFFAVVTLLSNMVWGIEIKGANPATEYKIQKELEKMEVKTGKFQFFIPNAEDIQRNLTDRVQEITWVGVELKGTTYHFQVVEKNEPEQTEHTGPRHLVAKKKAVIVDMFVEEGLPQVDINEMVKPGQILVSGIYGKEDKAKTVSAKGEVFGETWYKVQAKQPLNNTLHVFNGKEKIKHHLKIGNWKLPIWGYGKIEFKEFEAEENEKKLQFLKWKLPISYQYTTYRERELISKNYTKKEAIELAMESARNKIKSELDENAKIKGENVLHQSSDNGKVTVLVHFQIIENIAQAQSFTPQGDAE